MPKRKGRPERNAPSSTRRLAVEFSEAQSLIRRKRYLEARDLLESLALRYPHDAGVLGTLANVYHSLHDTLGYERACERLIKLDPDDPDVTLGLGGAYLTNVRPALALRIMRRFLDRWPDHARAAEVRRTVADLETTFSTVLADMGLSGPDGPSLAALHEEAQVLLERDNYAEARKVGEQLLRQRPDYVPMLNNLSQIYAADGQFDRAIATAQRVLALDPDNFHALGNLTRYFCLTGRLDEALQMAEQLKTVESEHDDVWAKKAEALSYLGDDQGVLDAFSGAERAGVLKTAPGDALLYHLAAVAAMRLGRTDEARRRWQQALKLAPGLDLARENLADLDRPVGERHAPWAFSLANWVARQVVAGLSAQVKTTARHGATAALSRTVQQYLDQHPELVALIPMLLDRGDSQGRDFALRLASLARTPELLAALRDFALGQRGPDALRLEAAQVATHAGLLPRGPIRLWQQGEWREVLLMDIEVYGEPLERHQPRVQSWVAEAMAALHAGDGQKAESLLKRAIEVEPDAPDLFNNLAAAYQLQGRRQEFEAIVRQLHERHPDYLFGRVNMASLHIDRGQLAEAKALLDPLVSRTRLHYSELAALCGAQIELLLAEGKRDGARSWLDLWASVDPNHPAIGQFRRRLGQTDWKRILGRRP